MYDDNFGEMGGDTTAFKFIGGTSSVGGGVRRGLRSPTSSVNSAC